MGLDRNLLLQGYVIKEKFITSLKQLQTIKLKLKFAN